MSDLCNIERPVTFDQMVGQGAVVENLRSQAKKNKFFQCYILEGQFGSGKTSMARILSRAVNCEHPDENGNPCGCCPSCRAISKGTQDVIEMDAASNTGVDAIRGLKESVDFLPTGLRKKVYIIDEVHKLSDSAFNALLKVLEEPPAHVVFILCTTEMKKIPVTIRSRAACYHFAQISDGDLVGHLTEVADKHQYAYTDEGVRLIAANASGSMRNALKLLEQAVQMDGGVTEENVREMLGLTDPAELFGIAEAILGGQIQKVIPLVRKLLEKGANPLSMVSDLMDIFADAVVCVMTGGPGNKNTAHYRSLLGMLCKNADAESICRATNGLLQIYKDLQATMDETTLICGLIAMNGSQDEIVAALRKRVEALESVVASISKSGTAVVMQQEHARFEPVVVSGEEVSALDTSEHSDEQEGPEEISASENAVSEGPDPEPDDAQTCEVEPGSDSNAAVEASDEVDPFSLLGMYGFSEPESESVDEQVNAGEQDSQKQGEPVEPDYGKPEEQEPVSEIKADENVENNTVDESTDDTAENQPVYSEPAEAEMPLEEPESNDRDEAVLDDDDASWAMYQASVGAYVSQAEADGFVSASGKMGEDIPFFEGASGSFEDGEAVFAQSEEGSSHTDDRACEEEDLSDKEEFLPANATGNLKDFLPKLYQECPVMESVLELGFSRQTAMDGTVEYVTKMAPMFRIAKSYRDVVHFPFAIRKVC